MDSVAAVGAEPGGGGAGALFLLGYQHGDEKSGWKEGIFTREDAARAKQASQPRSMKQYSPDQVG